ncbi:MAG: type III restriction endonuclease subunit R, partial [Fimbriimonadaceae bacterium]
MIEELCDPERILHIDSKVLRDAEAAEDVEMPEEKSADDDEDAEPSAPKLTKKQQAQLLRLTVDSVGQPGKPGAMIQNVISVGMLSEGWDAKTVTHIMGLRAFSSQLLCEQVVGRGLRRTSYELINDRFEPEYVNIFGVPFTFIPHEDPGEIKPRPPKPTTRVEAVKERIALDIDWPNVIRIDREYRPQLEMDLGNKKPLVLDAYKNV